MQETDKKVLDNKITNDCLHIMLESYVKKAIQIYSYNFQSIPLAAPQHLKLKLTYIRMYHTNCQEAKP